MVRKIAGEEHCLCPGCEDYWAPTVVDLPAKRRDEFYARLTDFGEMRIAAMDRAGVERCVLSLAGPGVQAKVNGSLVIVGNRRMAGVGQVADLPVDGQVSDLPYIAARLEEEGYTVLYVTVDRKLISKKRQREVLFNRIAGPLGTTPDGLQARYDDVKYDPLLPLPLADDVSEATATYLREREEDYPGVDVLEGAQRVYRFAPYGSHIVGYMGAIEPADKDTYLRKGYLLSDRVGTMSARPGRFLDIVVTGWPRERDSKIVSEPGFAEITGRLWDNLRGESLKSLGYPKAAE